MGLLDQDSKELEAEGKKTGDLRKTPLGIERRFDRFGDWLDDSWLLRKMAPVLTRYPWLLFVVAWIIRLVVGGVFILSGLTKGIDPWGTYYKMVEYLTAMHLPISEWGNTVLVLDFLLFVVEFLVGVSLVLGCFRKASPIFAALFMIVMLPLTFWIALTDPVADCGCFGDFIVISNWGTFLKNCFISLGVVWLLKFNVKAKCLISPYLQWIAAVAVAGYICIVGYIGYWQQPTVDFRPYKIGSRLLADEEQSEYLPVYEFLYERNGETMTLGEDDELPDESEGWKFIKRIEKSFVKNDNAQPANSTEVPDFRIWSEDGEDDVTESLSGFDRQLILLVPDIESLSMATSWKINKLYDMAKAADTEFIAVVAGSEQSIEEWKDLSSGQYPIYTAEDTSIKELARGNPSLVSLENGIIKWKSALSGLLIEDDDESMTIITYPISMNKTGGEVLLQLSIILFAVLAVLITASLVRFRLGTSHTD